MSICEIRILPRPPLLVACMMALAGCGGGGSDVAPTIGPTAEGVYGGTLTGSASNAFQLLVLENGDFWAMYGTQADGVFGVAGFIQGSGTSTSGRFTSSSTEDFGFAPAMPGSTSATYDAAAKTIAGTFVAGGTSVAFSGGPIAGSLYNYNTPATLASIAGAWSIPSPLGQTNSLVIDATGALTATATIGCSFSGTLTPRQSGKNVFNASLTFGAIPCALAGQTATGIAVAYPLSSGQTQLLIAVVDASRTIGAAVSRIGVVRPLGVSPLPPFAATPNPRGSA